MMRCFWCVEDWDNTKSYDYKDRDGLIAHTKEKHPGLTPRSYDLSKDIIFDDLKLAAQLLKENNPENPEPCYCEELKKSTVTGRCEKHGVIKLSEQQHILLKELFK